MFTPCSTVLRTDPSAISRMGSSAATPGYDCTWANYGLMRGGLMRLWTLCWQLDSFQGTSRRVCVARPLQRVDPDGLSELPTPLVSSPKGLQVQAQPQNLPEQGNPASSPEVGPTYGLKCFWASLSMQSLVREAVTGNLSGILCINLFRHWFSSHSFQSYCKTTLQSSPLIPWILK